MSTQSIMNAKFLSHLEMLSFLFLCDRGSQKRPARSPQFQSLMLHLKIVAIFKPTVATTSSATSPHDQRQVFQNTKSVQVKSPLASDPDHYKFENSTVYDIPKEIT